MPKGNYVENLSIYLNEEIVSVFFKQNTTLRKNKAISLPLPPF